MQIRSILSKIAEEVFLAQDFKSAQDIFMKHVSESKIKSEDKAKMLSEVARMDTLTQIQLYTANALLKYEGLGTI